MRRIGLTLNEQKTSIRDALTEDFDFLGYTFGPRYWWKTGQRYTAARPSKRSIQRLTAGVYDLLQAREKGSWPEVCKRLNTKLQGWQNYFGYGSIARAFHIVNRYVEQRVRNFLRQRHRHSTSGTYRFPSELIFGRLGVHRLVRLQPV